MPMAIGLLLEAFGPRSLPWTILMCAVLQVVLYFMLHILGTQTHDGSSSDGVSDGTKLMDSDTEEYSKISLDTLDDEEDPMDTDVEMVSYSK